MEKLRAEFIHSKHLLSTVFKGLHSVEPRDAKMLIVPLLINMSINSDIWDRWDTSAGRIIMDSIADWVTLELRLGGVAGISQVEQVGKSIPGRRYRDAEVTSINRKFSWDGI